MDTLREVLKHAETEGVAIGHFNVSDWVTLKAVFESARERNVPVIVGVSESERQFLGVRQIAAMVKSLREEYDFPVFLNADHSHSLASAVKPPKPDLIRSYSIFLDCRWKKISARREQRWKN